MKRDKNKPVAMAAAANGLERTRSLDDPRHFLDRILDTPQLAHVVSRLPPELLHRIIQRCGLEECGELVALATPGQLARVLDLDLWRAGQPGVDERFDAERFGVWLEVLVESGAAIAAQKLAEMDVDVVVAGLAHHARVFDRAAVTAYTTLDGDEIAPIRDPGDGVVCDVGGYTLVARRTTSWDAIVAALMALGAEHHDCFDEVMRGCVAQSNSAPEIDGLDDLLDDGEQLMFDVAFDRERRRERHGYVTPPQARAFLQMARQLRLDHATRPPVNPIASAYLGGIDRTIAEETTDASIQTPALLDAPNDPVGSAEAVAAVMDVLSEAGIVAPPPRALLTGTRGDAQRLARIQAHMQFALERDHGAYAKRTEELGYLANTLIAGCSIQARPFTEQEALDAAVAVCNLGLENWPAHWLAADARQQSSVTPVRGGLPDDFLVDHDLVAVFQVGWTVLHDEVSMCAAGQLLEVLTRLSRADSETAAALDDLRIELTKQWRAGTPWRARDALDVIAILDTPAWAILLALIDECPVMHAALAASRDRRPRAVSASASEFISENSQIATIREFMQSLEGTLRG